MRKLKLYIAISLDGFVADENGGVSFLGGDGSDEQNFGSYPDFIETIDTVILGYSTYNQIVTELSPDEWPYKGKTSYILTHRDIPNKEEINFTSKDIVQLLEELKKSEGKDLWLCGGANIAMQFHELGLIDEYTLSIIPIILGGGVKLFTNTDFETKLKLKSTTSYNGIVDVVYEKR